jgi:hypothetical protein
MSVSEDASVENTDLEGDQSSYLDMSDEDFLAMPSSSPETNSEEAEADDDDDQDHDQHDDEDDSGEGNEAPDDSSNDVDNSEPSSDDAGEGEPSGSDETSDEAAPPNYEEEFKKLTSPFRANGKDMTVDNVDDAIKLMQMGANYNRKMAAMKPGLKVLKMLENHGLLDETKLSYLIDLDKKDPAAIKKLVKDSEIGGKDFDYDEEDTPEYKSKDYGVDDKELQLDAVIDELKDTPTYSKTLDIVGAQWDDKSKQTVAEQPNLLRDINAHVANGIYDLVSTEVERERSFGRIDAQLNDIEAYQQVGARMGEAGAFEHLLQGKTPQQQKAPDPKPALKQQSQNEDKRRAKRKAASATKPALGSGAPQDFNPLALSDEEFLRQTDPRLM